MRLIVPLRFSLWKRAAVLFAADALLMTVALWITGRIDNVGTIELQTGNFALFVARLLAMLLYASLVWVWIMRPARHNLEYFPSVDHRDRVLGAWFVLLLCGTLFALTLLCFDTSTVNRMKERSSQTRSVLAREFDWQAESGGGKGIPRHRYTATGLLFPDAANRGIERVRRPGGRFDGGTTCFVEHVGWLGYGWISGVQPCDRPVEHIRLARLNDVEFDRGEKRGSQCVDDPAAPASEPTHDPSQCPPVVDEGGQWRVTAGESVVLPLPSDYWIAPRVVSVSPDGNRILVGDVELPSQLFLWTRRSGTWVALQLPEARRPAPSDTYMLTDDARTILDCPRGSAGDCARWVIAQRDSQ